MNKSLPAVIVFLIMLVGIVLVSMSRSEEQVARSIAEGQLHRVTASYRSHLVDEYSKTVCEFKNGVMETEKDRACFDGIRKRAEKEVEKIAERN